MNAKTHEMADIVPCKNLFSSHHQSLMSEILHFLKERRFTFSTRCVET